MKLLLDENLSPKLVVRLSDLSTGSTHVELVGLGSEDDLVVWEHALKDEFIIVTKDSDFNDLSVIKGYPPYIVWIRRGNCSTDDIASMIRSNAQAIIDSVMSRQQGIIMLF